MNLEVLERDNLGVLPSVGLIPIKLQHMICRLIPEDEVLLSGWWECLGGCCFGDCEISSLNNSGFTLKLSPSVDLRSKGS